MLCATTIGVHFFYSVHQTMLMEGHWLMAHQRAAAEDGVRASPPLVSFCSIHVLAARYLSSFHHSEEIRFFL